jgi:dienelactone hydrolase
MNRMSALLAGMLVFSGAVGMAQPLFAPPPPVKPPTKEQLQEIEAKTAKLAAVLHRLRNQDVHDPALADVEIYHKAAVWTVRHNEFFHKDTPEWTLAALDRGLLRASKAAGGEMPWWNQFGQPVVRAYRSRIDGSVQPYAVTYPEGYGSDREKRYRLDIVLHGRNSGLTEVSFLNTFRGEGKSAKGQSWVQIDIYGRGNNAYRWAGESDVLEAIENFVSVEVALGRGGLIDHKRAVLRGFSMGGAGTWHLGLHRPDLWAVIGPGAGFTTTHGYVKGLGKLPDYQESTLHIYDAVDYAENASMVPVVAYDGEKDSQLQAARSIEEKLKPLGIPMTLLVAPGLAHQFPPEWQKKAETEYQKHLKEERPEYPKKVRFVTWTLKYPSCHWVEFLGLEKHCEKASIEAERIGDEDGFAIKTTNARQLHLNLWRGAIRSEMTITIDGQKLERVRPYQARNGELHFYLEKRDGKWAVVWPERLAVDRARHLQKSTGLQGPIDDAFIAAFLCVRGSGTAWNPEVQAYADAALERFKSEWGKYLRGDLPVKEDTEVTPEDLATRHLVVFGDPGSNNVLAQALPALPLTWTKKEITWNDKTYPASSHVPVLVYPSPLAANHYIVVNSGHTFHAADFEATNAMLYPRLGDRAVLKLVGGKDEPLKAEVVEAGLFDDFWR